jgi:phosphohistidine phosphatase
MLLYLVQHGEAKKKEEDPSRGLTVKGINDVEKVSGYMSELTVQVDQIFHSGKLRAEQTADIFTESLKPVQGIAKTNGLLPLDNPSLFIEKLLSIESNIMLVGHLPHLGKLASLLLCGDTDKYLVSFKMAGVVCLARDNNGLWSLQWMITPAIVI